MTQKAIKTRNDQNKTAMIVSRVASEFIRNMNETEDSIKTETKNMQNHEHPNKLDMMKINYKKRKQQKASEFQKLTQNRLVYDKSESET
jgi:hypothetical protein